MASPSKRPRREEGERTTGELLTSQLKLFGFRYASLKEVQEILNLGFDIPNSAVNRARQRSNLDSDQEDSYDDFDDSSCSFQSDETVLKAPIKNKNSDSRKMNHTPSCSSENIQQNEPETILVDARAIPSTSRIQKNFDSNLDQTNEPETILVDTRAIPSTSRMQKNIDYNLDQTNEPETILVDARAIPSTSRMQKNIDYNLDQTNEPETILVDARAIPSTSRIQKNFDSNLDQTNEPETILVDTRAIPSTSRMQENIDYNLGQTNEPETILVDARAIPSTSRIQKNFDSNLDQTNEPETILVDARAIPSTSRMQKNIDYNLDQTNVSEISENCNDDESDVHIVKEKIQHKSQKVLENTGPDIGDDTIEKSHLKDLCTAFYKSQQGMLLKHLHRPEYVDAERNIMIWFLIAYDAIELSRGFETWKIMMKRRILPYRTYQSLHNQFTKTILPKIEYYKKMPEEYMYRFLELKKSTLRNAKKRQRKKLHQQQLED